MTVQHFVIHYLEYEIKKEEYKMAENKLENSLKIAIGQSVNKCFETVDITPENIMIEIPKDSTHGDYSTNIAMQLTRTLHKNPR